MSHSRGHYVLYTRNKIGKIWSCHTDGSEEVVEAHHLQTCGGDLQVTFVCASGGNNQSGDDEGKLVCAGILEVCG